MTEKRSPPPAGTRSVVVHEYSNVADFLLTLTHAQLQVEVFLAPVFRPQYSDHAIPLLQAGVMLNGHVPGYRGIMSCIALAAEATLVAERGRLFFPERGSTHNSGIRQRIHDLQQELLVALTDFLCADTRIGSVRHPASLWKPTTLLWSPAALDGLPITYREGHWTLA